MMSIIDHSQTIDDVYENLEDYDQTKKRKMLILFDDMVADMEANKILTPIVIELFLRGKNTAFCSFLYRNLLSKCLKLQD